MSDRLSSNRFLQVTVALAASGVLTLSAVVFNHPLVLVAAGLVPIVGVGVLRMPLPLVLGFAIFSFFRIHEVFPVLYSLRIPQLLALGALASLGWGMWSGRISIYWSRELTAFSIFFAAVSVGVIFSTNLPEAWAAWSGTYVKIGIMTLALTWLVSSPSAFHTATRVIIAAGILVAVVALYNKINGIGLVEGTRVTIGRDIGSMLGDPNDLALVLLFPASFAVAVLLSKSEGKLSKTLAAIGIVTVFAAVIATQSRGGLLGIIAVMGVFAWRRIPSKGLLIALAAITLLALFAVAGVGERASGGANEAGIDESAMGRIYAWGAAWEMAISNPLTGVGLANFLSNYWAYSSHWDGQNHAVHSTWFGVLAETGFLGFILFMAMVVVTVRSAIWSVGQLQGLPSVKGGAALVMAEAVEAGLFGFLVSGTFLTMGFTWPFYILLALTTAISQYVRRASFSDSQVASVG
jgi:putative inorganic carbon (hco3(-)) transporter